MPPHPSHKSEVALFTFWLVCLSVSTVSDLLAIYYKKCSWNTFFTKLNTKTSFSRSNKWDSPYSITEHRVLELVPVLGSQPAGDVSHKPGSRLRLLYARPAVTPATLKMAATNFCCLMNTGTMGMNSLPKTVIRTQQHRNCDLNPGPYAPESSTLTTRLPRSNILQYILLSFKVCEKYFC